MVFDEIREKTWASQEALFLRLLEKTDEGNELYAAARYQVLSGGKRLRALLPVMVQRTLSEAWNRPQQEDMERALWSGLAVELLHSATLCHDDVMDGDRMRRDQPTVWVEYGLPQAINAGDLLFFTARDALARAPFQDRDKLRALAMLSDKISYVIQGQGLETTLLKQRRAPDLESYERIAQGKTGGLFALCFVLGAMACEADSSIVETVDEAGMNLGWIFQVQDDLIDLIGEKGRGFRGNDLLEGKPSWLVASCCGVMPPDERQRFLDVLYQPRAQKTEAELKWLTAAVKEAGAVAQGMNAVEARAQDLEDKIAASVPALKPLVNYFLSSFLDPLRAAYACYDKGD